MKKVLLLITIILTIFVMTARANYNEGNLEAIYDSENRQCNITNTSMFTNYKDLVVTVVLDIKDNSSDEVVFDIGPLKYGETYKGDLSHISEEKEILDVHIASYEHYENKTYHVICWCLFVIGWVILVTAMLLKNRQ